MASILVIIAIAAVSSPSCTGWLGGSTSRSIAASSTDACRWSATGHFAEPDAHREPGPGLPVGADAPGGRGTDLLHRRCAGLHHPADRRGHGRPRPATAPASCRCRGRPPACLCGRFHPGGRGLLFWQACTWSAKRIGTSVLCPWAKAQRELGVSPDQASAEGMRQAVALLAEGLLDGLLGGQVTRVHPIHSRGRSSRTAATRGGSRG